MRRYTLTPAGGASGRRRWRARLRTSLPRLLWLLALVLAAQAVRAEGQVEQTVVATTSMLECVLTDVLGDRGAVRVYRLVPPGACPGHFDLSPRDLPLLREARMLVRHDFQQVLDQRIRQLTGGDLAIVSVSAEGSLLIPDNYLRMCRSVSSAAEERTGIARGRTGLERLTARLAALSDAMRTQAEPWRGTPVIASSMQEGFCRWLGLDVVGVLSRPEDLSPRELGVLSRLRPAFVVGNLQSDVAAATTLAQRLDVPCAILSNFPGAEGYGTSYDDLIAANLAQLAQAWSLRPSQK